MVVDWTFWPAFSSVEGKLVRGAIFGTSAARMAQLTWAE
jgi:hypothetical protein